VHKKKIKHYSGYIGDDGELSDETFCIHCGSLNPLQNKFCSNCTLELVMLEAGKIVPVNPAFRPLLPMVAQLLREYKNTILLGTFSVFIFVVIFYFATSPTLNSAKVGEDRNMPLAAKALRRIPPVPDSMLPCEPPQSYPYGREPILHIGWSDSKCHFNQMRSIPPGN
jgi:hypothetical protein